MIKNHRIVSVLVICGGLLIFVHLFDSGKAARYANSDTEANFRENCEEKIIVDSSQASMEDILNYLKWKNSSSCLLAHDFGGRLLRTAKFVGLDGQKSVCLDRGIAPKPGSCIVYSFGVDDDWTFEDLMGEYGCKVFAFDPSTGKQDHKRNKQVYFFNMGLYGEDTTLNNQWQVRTLDSIHQKLKEKHGRSVIDYVKIDIEEYEWNTIPNMVESGILDNVKQIAFEIHLGVLKTLDEYRDRYRIVRSIEQAGFVRFNSKGNPWMKTGLKLRESKSARIGYEIVWYNPKFYGSDDSV